MVTLLTTLQPAQTLQQILVAVAGQPVGLRPNHLVWSPDGRLYLSYGREPGPNGMSAGAVVLIIFGASMVLGMGTCLVCVGAATLVRMAGATKDPHCSSSYAFSSSSNWSSSAWPPMS